MIYVIITTSLVPYQYELRKSQYLAAIKQAIKVFSALNAPLKIVIVENNNNTASFLDELGADVLYTDTNFTSPINNMGYKELSDIFLVLKKYNVQDDDFVVKITGRYFITDYSPFVKELTTITSPSPTTHDCITIKVPLPTSAYNTGLIGMKAKWYKQIELPRDNTVSVELNYTAVIKQIQDSAKICLETLGIYVSPSNLGMNNYVLI